MGLSFQVELLVYSASGNNPRGREKAFREVTVYTVWMFL